MQFNSVKALLFYAIIATILFSSSISFAQEVALESHFFDGCYFDTKHQETFKNDEKYRENVLNFEIFYQQRINAIANGDLTNFATEVTIPVVVHIIHLPGTPVGTAENLSLAQIEAGIEHLNQGFRNIGDYAGDSRLAAANAALASADIQLNFCLAKRDPNGNATNGIVRVASALSNVNPDLSSSSSCRGDQDGELKDLSRWDQTKYLNIWLVKQICTGTTTISCGTAGYAYLSGAHGQCYDGVVNEASYWGSSTDASKVHIHEVGHYFNLSHTFNVPSGESSCQNNDCTSDGDFVCDTPPDNSTSGVSCGSAQNSCSTDANSGFSSDVEDMYENYMDYSRQNCQNTFTEGQKTRMRAALDGTRASLKTSDGCTEVAGNFAYFEDISTGAYEVNATNVSGCRKYYDLNIPIALYKTATSASTVTVTVSGTSTANSPGDIELLSSATVNFATSESSKNVTVRVYGDEISESTETFILTISNVSGEASAAAFNQTHTVNIINNDSGGASFTGSGNISAEAGNAALNLSLSPEYGTSYSNFNGTLSSSDGSSNLAYSNNTTKNGPCGGPSNSNYYETYTFYPDATATYSFSRSGSPHVNVYLADYDPNSVCSNFLGSMVYDSNPSDGFLNISSSLNVNLTANVKYTLVVAGFNTSYVGNYTFTYSGGTLYDGTPNPGASYTYTYMAVNTTSGVIGAISASSDFTGLSAGTYTVYGVTILTSDVSSFNAYAGTNISAIYSGAVCPVLSTNTITLTVTAPACTNPTPSLGTVTNPTTCGGTNGSIQLTGLTANTAYTLNYKKDNVAATAVNFTSDNSGNYVLASLSEGAYTEINVTISTCTSSNLMTTLSDPTGSTAAVMSGSTTISSGQSTNISVEITGGTSPYTLIYGTALGNTIINGYISKTAISVSPPNDSTYSIVSVTDANGCIGTGNTGSAIIAVNEACPTTLAVSTVTNNETYKAANTLTSNATIPASNAVTFMAGQSITLGEGFTATATSNFTASIAACTSLQAPPEESVARNSTKNILNATSIEMVIRPNPARDFMTIDYQLNEATMVQIGLFDLAGKQLSRISPIQSQNKGRYQQQVSLNELNAGIYFIILQTEKERISKKLIVVR